MEKDQNIPFRNEILGVGDVVVVHQVIDGGSGNQKTEVVGSGTVQELGPGVWIKGLRRNFGIEEIMRGESGNLRFQVFYPDD